MIGCQHIDAEAAVYHIRHVRHDAAHPNLLLRQTVGDAPRCVRKAS